MRSVNQIYSEIVINRNNYLQLTELNSGRSNSKLSILNLLTYIMAVAIYTYEAVISAFQLRLLDVINNNICGTPQWYVEMIKRFQYDSAKSLGDPLIFNADTLRVEYENVDTTKRIVTQASWGFEERDKVLTIKTAKENSDTNEINNGTPITQLSDAELTALQQYIQSVKFVGANIICMSLPGDILTVVADEESPIYYNETLVTAQQALEAIRKSLTDFISKHPFNAVLYKQAILDVIAKTDGIVGISDGIKVITQPFSTITGAYRAPIDIKVRVKLSSGYMKLLDTDSIMTVNENNIKLVPSAQMPWGNNLIN